MINERSTPVRLGFADWGNCSRLASLVLLFLFGVCPARAATWYVERNAGGLNNGTSWANAWANTTSINWSLVNPGDTIYLSGGTAGLSYSAFTTAKNGTSVNRIRIQRSTESGRNGTVTLASPVQVPTSFLTIDGITWAGIILTCDTSAGGGGGGSLYITGDDFEVKHVKFSGNYAQGNSYHSVCASYECETILIQYCDFYKTTGEDHIVWRGNRRIAVDHCVFTTPNPPNDGAHRDLVNPWEANGGGYDLIFTHNIVYGLATSGFAFLFQDQAEVGNILIAYNVFANSPYVVRFGSGNSGARSLVLQNNVFYNTQDTLVAPLPTQRNNIYYGPGFVSANLVHDLNGTVDHSIWFNCGDFQAGTGNLNNTDPLFINVNSPLGADGIPFTTDDGFNLRPGSPAINAGAPTGDTVDIMGNPIVGEPDIGAYEYTPTGPATNPMIAVAPQKLTFGSVAVGLTKDLSFAVRNSGGGLLAGSISVPAPFAVVSGGSYSLSSNQSQTVVIRYSPTSVGSYSRSAVFTGGGGTTAQVTGDSLASTQFKPSKVLASLRVMAHANSEGGLVPDPKR